MRRQSFLQRGAGRKFLPDVLQDLKIWCPFAADGQYFTRANGLIQTWADQSGNGNDLTQATADNRPVDGSVGANLVTNGTFAADTDWTKGTGWTIAAGVADSDGTQVAVSDLSQAITLTDSANYLITYVVTRSAGTVTPFVGGTAGTARSAAGTYSDVITASTTDEIALQASADFVGTIDNVTVQEITQDGTVYFPGVDEYLKAAAFTWNQPETVYILFKQVTWADNEQFFDGENVNTGNLLQRTTTPDIAMFSGAYSNASSDLVLDTYGVVACVFDGASSLFQVNNGSVVTGASLTSGAMGGFVLGANPTPAAFSNIQVKEVIGYAAAHDAVRRKQIIDYLLRVNAL